MLQMGDTYDLLLTLFLKQFLLLFDQVFIGAVVFREWPTTTSPAGANADATADGALITTTRLFVSILCPGKKLLLFRHTDCG